MEDLRCPAFVVNHLTASPNASSYSTESAVYVNCETGYKLSGSHLIYCNNGSWIPTTPECTPVKWMSTKSSSTVIITVCTIASVVAVVIILCAAYMLTRNWRRDRSAKRKQDDCRNQILESSNYFITSQDCVGMPPLVYENIDQVMRGRGSSSSTSSATTCSVSTDVSIDGEHTPSYDKVFSY